MQYNTYILKFLKNDCWLERSPKRSRAPKRRPLRYNRRSFYTCSMGGNRNVTSRNFMFVLLIIQSLIPLPGRLGVGALEARTSCHTHLTPPSESPVQSESHRHSRKAPSKERARPGARAGRDACLCCPGLPRLCKFCTWLAGPHRPEAESESTPLPRPLVVTCAS